MTTKHGKMALGLATKSSSRFPYTLLLAASSPATESKGPSSSAAADDDVSPPSRRTRPAMTRHTSMARQPAAAGPLTSLAAGTDDDDDGEADDEPQSCARPLLAVVRTPSGCAPTHGANPCRIAVHTPQGDEAAASASSSAAAPAAAAPEEQQRAVAPLRPREQARGAEWNLSSSLPSAAARAATTARQRDRTASR